MALKADLINSVVAQTHGLPDSLNGPVSESLVGVCEVSSARPVTHYHIVDHLTMCQR